MHPKTLVARSHRATAGAEIEHTAPNLHLVDLTRPDHTLCGLELTECALGVYAEHITEAADPDGKPLWERTIFPLSGDAGLPCPACLTRQQPVLADR